MVAEIVATFACGMFAGAAIYINFVEQSARLSCGIEPAVREWRPSYQRGTWMQAPLALTGSIAALVAWWFERRAGWLLGGILLFLVIPFTLLVIFPTNIEIGKRRTGFAVGRGGAAFATVGLASCGPKRAERGRVSYFFVFAC